MLQFNISGNLNGGLSFLIMVIYKGSLLFSNYSIFKLIIDFVFDVKSEKSYWQMSKIWTEVSRTKVKGCLKMDSGYL